MAGATETLTLNGLAEWAAKTGQSLQQLDLRKAWGIVRTLMRSSILENFNTSTAPDGTPWPALARPRANSQGNDQPLRDKGLLMASATAGAGVDDNLFMTIELSSNLDYAATHQYGGNIFVPEMTPKNATALRWFSGSGTPIFSRRAKAHDVTIPQRQFMGFKEKDVEQISEIVGEVVGEQIQ